MKGQAFSRSYYLAPRTPPTPTGGTQGELRKRDSLLTGEGGVGGAGGEEPNQTATRKPVPL